MKIRILLAAAFLPVVALIATPTSAAPTCLGRAATIVGTGGADALFGTARADVIFGGQGNDEIRGRGGEDRICGAAGSDEMIGNKGNDRMDGGPGPDVFNGGQGRDWAIYDRRTSKIDIVIDNQANDGDIDGEGDYVLTNVEVFVGGHAGDGFVGGVALDLNQTFFGGPGGDDVSAGAGDDRMFGERAGDNLNGQDGDDFANGGRGDDDCDAEELHNCEVA
jgi:Ca2+-binding RTX toxin-like protein